MTSIGDIAPLQTAIGEMTIGKMPGAPAGDLFAQLFAGMAIEPNAEETPPTTISPDQVTALIGAVLRAKPKADATLEGEAEAAESGEFEAGEGEGEDGASELAALMPLLAGLVTPPADPKPVQVAEASLVATGSAPAAAPTAASAAQPVVIDLTPTRVSVGPAQAAAPASPDMEVAASGAQMPQTPVAGTAVSTEGAPQAAPSESTPQTVAADTPAHAAPVQPLPAKLTEVLARLQKDAPTSLRPMAEQTRAAPSVPGLLRAAAPHSLSAQPDLGTGTRPQSSKRGDIAAAASTAPTLAGTTTPIATVPLDVAGLTDAATPADTLVDQPVPSAEAAIERHLDVARDAEWLDQLARDIASSGDGQGPMRFRLNPETLGSLEVEVVQGNQGASIRMTVETDAARAILDDAQPKLAAEARAQGVRIAETHVELAGGQAGRGDARQQNNGGREPFVRTWQPMEAESDVMTPSGRDSARYA